MKKKILLLSLFTLFALPIFAQNVFDAVQNNDIPGIQFLAANGSNLNARNAQGETPLIIAVANGQLRVAKILLELNANIDMKDKKGNTALIEAVNTDKLDIVKYLINRGADISITDKKHMSAADYAKIQANADMLTLFKSNI
jgi:ankyrin repeat protein